MNRKPSTPWTVLLAGALALLASCNAESGTLGEYAPGSPGGEPDYGIVYDTGRVNTFRIEVSASRWASMRIKLDGEFLYVPATVTFVRDGCEEVYEDVGVRFKGNSSYYMSGEKKSFKFHFAKYDASQRFYGCKKINLNNSFHDPSLMRELLAYELFREMGVAASQVSYTDLYITVPGVYDNVYFGVYFNVEQVSKPFLRHHFNEDGGNLFKAVGMNCDLTWLGPSPSAYWADYELKTNEDAYDYTDLVHLADVISNTSDGDFPDAIEAALNMENFLAWLAVNTALSFQDSLAGTGHNFYIYHNLSTGKFEFIPWDLNTTFGQSRFGKPADYFLTLDIYQPTFGNTRLLIDRVLAVPSFLSRYEAILTDLMDRFFNNAIMDARIETNYGLIRDLVHLDAMKDFTNLEFDLAKDQDIPDAVSPDRTLGLKPYVADRKLNMETQLP